MNSTASVESVRDSYEVQVGGRYCTYNYLQLPATTCHYLTEVLAQVGYQAAAAARQN